jgi:hypothetical protein
MMSCHVCGRIFSKQLFSWRNLNFNAKTLFYSTQKLVNHLFVLTSYVKYQTSLKHFLYFVCRMNSEKYISKTCFVPFSYFSRSVTFYVSGRVTLYSTSYRKLFWTRLWLVQQNIFGTLTEKWCTRPEK